MRNLGLLSVLLLGVSTVAAQAGNYVPQQSYSNPNVVVNMDVFAADNGMGAAPVLQQPLQPPRMMQPPIVAQEPIRLRPPVPRPQPVVPMPYAAAPQDVAPLPPLRPPVLRQAAPQPVMPPMPQAMPMDVTAMPQPVQAAAPVALPPPMPQPVQAPAPVMAAPVQPQPFSTRELAANAQPLWDDVPPVAAKPVAKAPASTPPAPIAEHAPWQQSVKQETPKKVETVAALPPAVPPAMPVPAPPVIAAPLPPITPVAVPETKSVVAEKPLIEHPIWDEEPAKKPDIKEVNASPEPMSILPKAAPVVAKPAAPIAAPVATAAKTDTQTQTTNPARQLLAQAREDAGQATPDERKVVLFDSVPVAPAPVAVAAPVKKPTEKPSEKQVAVKTEPKKEAKKETLKTDIASYAETPVIDETPVMKTAAAAPAMPAPLKPQAVDAVAPIAALPPVLAPVTPPPPAQPIVPHSTEQVAALKPSALPQLAPAAIPVSPSVKKAETVIDDFEAYRLLFGAGSPVLQGTEQEVLDGISAKLKTDENIKLQLRAYANGTPDSSTQARRLSLARAMVVRSYLVQKGIAAARMDVRALGMGSNAMGDTAVRADTPPDRVDLIFTR